MLGINALIIIIRLRYLSKTFEGSLISENNYPFRIKSAVVYQRLFPLLPPAFSASLRSTNAALSPQKSYPIWGDFAVRRHLVPLLRQAVELLREIHEDTGDHRYVFPNYRNQ